METQPQVMYPVSETHLSAKDIKAQITLIQEVMRDVMKDGQHYGKIPGCGDKPTLLKPGAEKLSLVFKLRPIMDNDRDIQVVEYEDGHREVRVFCHIMNSIGQEIATGIGSASTKESKHRYRGGQKTPTDRPVPKEYWNLRSEQRTSEAQELIGGRGFGTMKNENGVWVICELGEKVENPDIADVYNTVLKMAKKRAYVDGILSATGASDIFTQDIEDMPEATINTIVEEKPVSSKPEVQHPQEIKPQEQAKTTETQANGNYISDAQSRRLYAIQKVAKYPEPDFKDWLMYNYNIEDTRKIQRKDYEKICNHVETYGKSYARS